MFLFCIISFLLSPLLEINGRRLTSPVIKNKYWRKSLCVLSLIGRWGFNNFHSACHFFSVALAFFFRQTYSNDYHLLVNICSHFFYCSQYESIAQRKGYLRNGLRLFMVLIYMQTCLSWWIKQRKTETPIPVSYLFIEQYHSGNNTFLSVV